jgi:hypothetical protein
VRLVETESVILDALETYCPGWTQIAAPSNELMPPMSMVRFDWIGSGQNAGLPVQTLRVVQGKTAAGNAEGSCTLIW